MLSFTKSPLVMLVSPIGQSEPWELTPFGGKVRCTPSLRREPEARFDDDRPVLLLSDWGYLDGIPVSGAIDAVQPALASRETRGPPRSDVVLLLPMSVMPLLATLRARATSGDAGGDDPLRHEDWCAVWPHYVGTDGGAMSFLQSANSRHACGGSFLPVAGSRRYVYGSLPGDVSPLPLVYPSPPFVDAALRVPEAVRLDNITVAGRQLGDGARDESWPPVWLPTVFAD